jgi:hypothetical protein
VSFVSVVFQRKHGNDTRREEGKDLSVHGITDSLTVDVGYRKGVGLFFFEGFEELFFFFF